MMDFVHVPNQGRNGRDHTEKESLRIKPDECLNENVFDIYIALEKWGRRYGWSRTSRSFSIR